MAGLMFFILQVLIAVDQLANAMLGGHADETLSARAWRTEQAGKVFGKFWRPVIDVVCLAVTFGRDKNHCYESYLSEHKRRQLHPHYSRS